MKTKNDKFRQRVMGGGEGKENCFKRALRNKTNEVKYHKAQKTISLFH